MERINKTLIVGVVFALISACTTQKSRDDLSLTGKLWHNTTAHYNGYYNANELLIVSFEQLEEQHEDNYNKLLEMYPYIAAENPQAVAPNLDLAIEKVSVVVNLHRQSQWTDDCYLLVGKSQFLKQDYEAAEETLRFMVDEFSPSSIAERQKKAERSKKASSSKKKKSGKKKGKVSKEREKARKAYMKAVKKARKKGTKAPSRAEFFANLDGEEKEEEEVADSSEEEESGDIGMISITDGEDLTAEGDPDSYFLKHRPAFQEGVLWLAKTLIERDNYEGARRYMGKLEKDEATFNDIRSQLAGIQAYYYLKRKEYDQATAYLDQAIEMENDRKLKARYSYIVAQLYQQSGKGEAAYAAFEKVLKYNPDFEMAFSARLNLALNSWYSGRGTAQDARDNLQKMLKESKNEAYRDQIYFALAEIDLKEGKREEAIKNLELSLAASRKNRSQKAESYLKLARLYFEVEEYVSAKNYFDSTLQVLSSADTRFNEVQRLSNNLTDIAENLKIITLQDSLLSISMMSEEDKRALAFEIRKQKEEERRQKLAAKTSAAAPGSKFNRGNMATASRLSPGSAGGALQAKSDFFAYDDKKVKRGKRDFERKWGSRPLEDNWRRSNSQSGGAFDEEYAVEEITDNVMTDEEMAKLLGDVPTTENEIETAHLKIREAMFKLGSLYRERLENYTKAVEVLEDLNRRYPSSNLELDSWYFLYLSYLDLNEQGKAREYANKILEKYPTSTYAKIIENPNYASELMDEEKKLNLFYEDAYASFTSGNYRDAYQKSVSAKEKFGAANTLQPRFALLTAMSRGNIEGKDAYVEGLKEVVAKYPGTPEQTRAREILRLLGESGAVLPGNTEEENTGDFKMEDDKLHYIVIVFKGDVALNDAKVAVSDFNRKYHKLDKLRISNVYLGTTAEDRLPIIVIRRFKDKAASMNYYSGAKKNSADFLDPKKFPHDIFAVTQNNYREILKNTAIEAYRAFFESNYLK